MPGRDDMELDLTGDISKLKKQIFTIKEGVQYKIRIDFLVQREIVHGLKYVQKTYRLCVPGKHISIFIYIYIHTNTQYNHFFCVLYSAK